jgi:peptidoglycan/xylan/chitin deacetylase (PgdA/CDA1 family)
MNISPVFRNGGKTDRERETNILIDDKSDAYQNDYKVDYLFGDTLGGWVNSQGNTAFSEETDHPYIRNYVSSLKVDFEGTAGNKLFEHTLSKSLNLYERTCALWIYFPTTRSRHRDKINYMNLHIHTSDGRATLQVMNNNAGFMPGWNPIIFENHHLNYDSGVTKESLKNVNRIGMLINTRDVAFTIYIDSLVSAKQPQKPRIRFDFDDGYKTIYNIAFPAMQKRGMRGVIGAITDSVGLPRYVTVEDLRHMESAGWDIISHSSTHSYAFDEPTTQEERDAIDYEIIESQKKLLEWGITRGPQFYMTPARHFVPYLQELTKKHYKLCRSGLDKRPESYLVFDANGSPSCYNVQAETLAYTKGIVDKVYEGKGFATLMWHDIGIEDTTWSVEMFEELLDYVQEKDIEVVTMTDQYNFNTAHGI